MTKAELRDELKPKVLLGVELLDQANPNWRKKIKSRLDIASCTKCVLGQIYDEYDDGANALGIKGFGHKYGFSLSVHHLFYPEKYEDAPGVLEELWYEEIAKGVMPKDTGMAGPI